MTTTDDTTTTGSVPVAGDVFAAVFDRIGQALDELAEVPAWTLSEQAVQERLGEALRLRSRFEEVTSRLLGSVADREVPRLAGASSPRGWLMATHGVSAADAARLVRETAVHAAGGQRRRGGSGGGPFGGDPGRVDGGAGIGGAGGADRPDGAQAVR